MKILSFKSALLFISLWTLSIGDAVCAESNTDALQQTAPQRLILALDGVPYDLFIELQKKGHFSDFRPAARMVAPFPSLSDVSFSAISGIEPPKSYQVVHYDPVRNRVVGNTMSSLSSPAHPILPSDSTEYSSMHRMFGYMVPYNTALYDMRQIGREFLSSRKQTFIAYLEQSDAVLHVQGRAESIRFLEQLDLFLQDLQQQVTARTGRKLLIDVVSDHGSTLEHGRFVDLNKHLNDCGFNRNNRIAKPNDVAYTLAGIIGSAAVTARPESVTQVAQCMAGIEGVGLVAVDRGDRVLVLSDDGSEAEIWPATGNEEAYIYKNLVGDPINLLPAKTKSPAQIRFLEADLFRKTVDHEYPDPLRRLWRAFHGAVQMPSPILVSLKDGYEVGNRTVYALANIRGRAGTHGSLTRKASLGILTSNWHDVHDGDTQSAYQRLFSTTIEHAAHSKTNEYSGALLVH